SDSVGSSSRSAEWIGAIFMKFGRAPTTRTRARRIAPDATDAGNEAVMGRLGRVQSRRYRVSGVPYDALTIDETLAQLEEAIRSRSAPLQHTAVIAAKIVRARSDPFLLESIEASDIVNVDGQAVVWAARLLGNPAPERVAGIDLMWELLQRAN